MKKSINLAYIIISLTFVFLCAVGTAFTYLSAAYPVKYKTVICQNAKEVGLAPSLVFAIARTESNFRANAQSLRGAVGIMQLMPETAQFTAKRYGVSFSSLTNPETNVKLACLYLVYLKGRFADETTLLCAYNAGEGTVRKWLSDPTCSPNGITLNRIPYPETERYVLRVKKFQNKYKKLYHFP